MSIFETFQPICHDIWREKYRFEGEEDQIATCRRVVDAVYANDTDAYREAAFSAMGEALFVPAGRILAGAGTGRDVTMINCFVMDTIDDSMSDIFRVLRESSLTMQQGGGIGMDFSTIRPEGALVKGVGADASGPLSFMDTWDAMCKTIMSAGTRRGAMMACLRCDHPDILKFIAAKEQPGRFTQFNLSVLITDEFMEAVEDDQYWQLGSPKPRTNGKHIEDRLFHEQGTPWYIYQSIRARELWNLILRHTYDHAEPGVIFIDRINKMNNLSYCETIAATNPCGEQPLPPYGDCILGAINLAQCVDNPWTKQGSINWDKIIRATKVGVRFLDNVIDTTNFPLKAQRKEAQEKRRIGLGVMGLANALAAVEVVYGSSESLRYTENIFKKIKYHAYDTSVMLAKEKGCFPLYSRDIIEAPGVIGLDSTTLQTRILQHGLRNGTLTTVAPTGTTAIWAGNVSSGIEPVFARKYNRSVLQDGGSKTSEECYDWGFLSYCKYMGMKPDQVHGSGPTQIITHTDLTVEDHLNVMAAAQKYVDASISKTINCPEDISFEEFEGVYQQAYDIGLKSCTTYRPNEITGSVLTSIEEGPAVDDPKGLFPVSPISELPSRPEALPGVTYKIKPGEHAYYITITDYNGAPYELFIATKEAAYSDWTAALGRMISAVWRRGGEVGFVAEELRQVHSANGGFWINGKFRPSIVAAIGDAISYHMEQSHPRGTVTPVVLGHASETMFKAGGCPRCQEQMEYKEGCSTCSHCGWSNCG